MSEYKDFISEASYKNSIHNIPNTNSQLAWFEEDGVAIPRLDADYIWQDAKYIPDSPEDDEYYAKIGQEKVLVYKKYTDLELTAVDGTPSTFYNEKFNHIIIKPNYHVTLADANDNPVPFGLKKWTYDANNGYLSFIDGTPDGYEAPFKVTFYRYEGRFLNETVLKRDGSVQMADEYSPEDDKDITTKEYVDDLIAQTGSIVDKLVPPVPRTLEGLGVEFESEKCFSAYDVSTGDFVEKVLLPDYDFSIAVPKFYNPGYGTVSVLINDFIIESINLENPANTGDIEITYNDDYYSDTLASRGFYNGIAFKFYTKPENLPQFYTSHTYMRIKFRYTYKDTTYDSEEVLIGLESEQVTDSFTSHFVLKPADSYSWRYISGVPSPAVGAEIAISGLKTKTLREFKSNNKIMDFNIANTNGDILPNNSYGEYFPLHELKLTYQVQSDWYYEDMELEANSYNIFGENNGTHNETFHFRCDTVSDESNRVFSGDGEYPDNHGGDWDSTKDLTETDELMMLNGKWQWPVDNFAVNGTDISSLTQWDATWIKAGPDYSQCTQEGVKYATFTFEIPLCNGVFIKVPEFSRTKNTKAFDIASCQIRVEGSTEWLNAKKAYKGIGIVKSQDEGCLAVQDCDDDRIYCTFGPKPLSGTLYIRFGLRYSNFRFSTPEVTPNI